MKTKIFLSCGQNKEMGEVPLAEKLRSAIEKLGFECYMAVADQSLSGLRENIFAQLETSEYFVFVDFKREQLSSSEYRGSLFTNQELALASYLQMPAILLQESGVKLRDGMIGCFQGNAHSFSDRESLCALVQGMIQAKLAIGEWAIDWKNNLSLHLSHKPPGDARQGGTPIVLRHFHISVRNNHRSKSALNCYVHLEAVRDVDTGLDIPVETIEFKWAGSLLPYVLIAPKQARRFDAFHIDKNKPSALGFKIHCDSTEYYPHIPKLGSYEFTYGVHSSNFPAIKRAFRVNITGVLETTEIKEC